MNFLSVDFILKTVWVVSTLLLATTAIMMFRRELHREYPWFFRYLLLVGGRAPLLFVVGRTSPSGYFYAYWIAEAFTVGLSFFVIYEIYQQVAGSSSLSVSRSTFFSLSVGFLAIAAVVALFMDIPAKTSPVVKGILVITHAARTMQVGLLALLTVASLFFNFYWKSVPFGFALGYGVYATLELAATAVRTTMGPPADTIFRLTKVLGYQLALVMWIAFIYRHREAHDLKQLPEDPMVDWLAVTERSTQ